MSMAIGGTDATAAPAPGTSSSLRALVRQTSALPRTAASRTQKARLRRAARRAAVVARRRPCAAVSQLAGYRRTLRGVRARPGGRFRRSNQRLAALGPASMRASFLLLRDSRTGRCGGAVKPSGVKSTSTRVISSDINGMRLRVRLPNLRFVERTAGGKSWTQLMLPNTDAPGAPGTPGIPMATSTFGIPDGATVSVNATPGESYTVNGVDVFPVQPDPVDQNRPEPDFREPPYIDKPFVIDQDAYARKGPVPAEPAQADALGTARDVQIGSLSVPSAQYDAAARKLTVLSSVDITVLFSGAQKSFSEQLGSPWEQPARRMVASLLNRNIINRRLFEIIRPCGEEMLVVTNPATLAAANSFATLKRGQGMRTTVVQTGAGGIGTTAAQIQAFIRGRVNNLLCIRPSYVTIMGDDDLVPTFTATPGGIPSDLQYAMKNDLDELPDVAVGRFIGNDQAAIQNAVNKVSTYETTPPTGPMLTRALMAAQFQDDDADGRENRTFITFAETVRNGLAARGVAVDRIYGDSPSATPQKFNDGSPLPASLLKPTFPWTGTGADVSAAWNQGRFMVLHRDHGWSDGWGTPGYGTADVNALTNGANLPVVLSINCSSGAYDYDETSFAGESLVKPNGGSVGVFGDTRDSPTWHNTQIALGFVDGLLPSVLPSEGPATKQRTGDALITGKLRLAGLAPPASDGSTRNELYLWHYFGDPAMQMWGGGSPPIVFNPNLFRALYKQLPPRPGDPPYSVLVSLPQQLNGQPVGLLQKGDVVGKALVVNGQAEIPALLGDGSVKPGDLQVAIDPDGAAPVKLGVDGVPPPPPPPQQSQSPPPPAATTLSMSCPSGPVEFGGTITVSGVLKDVPAGTPVDVTFKNPTAARGTAPPRTVVNHPETNADGAWSTSVDTTTNESGTWKVSSHYAGDSTHKESTTETCTVEVSTGNR